MSRVYFTDRDLGKRFPAILAAAGLTVERHHDLFQPEGSDEEWLEHCGTNARIARSHNERIRYIPNELAAVSGCADYLSGDTASDQTDFATRAMSTWRLLILSSVQSGY